MTEATGLYLVGLGSAMLLERFRIYIGARQSTVLLDVVVLCGGIGWLISA